MLTPYGTQILVQKATYMIQNIIQHVSDWANSWALNINKSKTVATLFSLSTSKEIVKLTLDNHPVPQVETAIFLGTTLDSATHGNHT